MPGMVYNMVRVSNGPELESTHNNMEGTHAVVGQLAT